ncbi:MAG TPA: hypothetical protein VFJ16_24620 [Longimicrobium sp.]|nr:hypothetical protein [Longimicrobium sp.]
MFERMHWLCFHLEFEHHGDPDVACGDPSCTWFQLEVYRRELQALGRDPGEVLERGSRSDGDDGYEKRRNLHATRSSSVSSAPPCDPAVRRARGG